MWHFIFHDKEASPLSSHSLRCHPERPAAKFRPLASDKVCVCRSRSQCELGLEAESVFKIRCVAVCIILAPTKIFMKLFCWLTINS